MDRINHPNRLEEWPHSKATKESRPSCVALLEGNYSHTNNKQNSWEILVKRIFKEVNNCLREEQAGFRPGEFTTEWLFILWNITEQAIEWKSNLYICFIDLGKAFDSVHRSTLWRIMKHYGISNKIIKLVQSMYNNSKCALMTGNRTTQWFEVKSGLKQGCNISGFLFILNRLDREVDNSRQTHRNQMKHDLKTRGP